MHVSKRFCMSHCSILKRKTLGKFSQVLCEVMNFFHLCLVPSFIPSLPLHFHHRFTCISSTIASPAPAPMRYLHYSSPCHPLHPRLFPHSRSLSCVRMHLRSFSLSWNLYKMTLNLLRATG